VDKHFNGRRQNSARDDMKTDGRGRCGNPFNVNSLREFVDQELIGMEYFILIIVFAMGIKPSPLGESFRLFKEQRESQFLR
jgi:hypothetical protein